MVQTLSETLASAIDHHRAGRFDSAETMYREILRQQPDHVDAIHLLGLIAHQVGRQQAALEYLTRAATLRPDVPELQTDLATAHLASGNAAEAASRCRRAVALRPDFAEAHCTLGNALSAGGELDEAAAHCRHAVSLRPENAEMQFCLANVLKRQGRLDEAVQCYQQVLEQQPDHVGALNNLANLYLDQGQIELAAQTYRRALAVRPDSADLFCHLGNALHRQRKTDQAIECYRQALGLQPDCVEALGNLAAVLKESGALDEAETYCRRAWTLRPESIEPGNNLGLVLEAQGRLDEAAECYRLLGARCPEEPLWALRAAALCPTVFEDTEQWDAYRQRVLDALNHFDQRDYRPRPEELVAAACYPPFQLQFDREDVRPIKEAFARRFEKTFAAGPAPEGSGQSRPRVGVVVTSGHEDVFLRTLGSVLRRIDTERFEIMLLTQAGGARRLQESLGRDEIRAVVLPDSFPRIVEVVRQSRCDVLYHWEIGTDPINYFLAHCRLAPVQCTSIGMQATSGIGAVDYYLSSRLAEPDDAEDHYSERLLTADTLLTFRKRNTVPAGAKTREQFGFDPTDHLYVCPQHPGKLHPDFDPILAEILRRDPRGKVVLTVALESGVGRGLHERYERTMPDTVDRVVLLPRLARPDYLGLVATADVLLDPPYFDGMNTTYDAFSLNQPIVTRPGRFRRGRYTAACYRKMGLEHHIARDTADYIDRAVRLGTDPDARHTAQATLRRASPALFQDESAVRAYEEMFVEMLENGPREN
ncbi:MAG: tetratricopeptide repeat protein [Pirellulales bacterium]|nr:tetratricopeptide repeat protein [Pirellulales bacterium]